MKKLQRGFIVPLIIVIVALLAVGGGVYVYQNKKVETTISPVNTEVQTTSQVQQVSTQNPPVTSTATTNLKTYSSSYFFQFQYPTNKGLTLNEESARALVTLTDSSQKFVFSAMASLGVFKNISDLRANVEKDIKHENEVNPTVNYKVSQIKFTGRDAISTEACIANTCRQHIYFSTEKYLYIVSIDKNSNKEVAEEISSSFKITQ